MQTNFIAEVMYVTNEGEYLRGYVHELGKVNEDIIRKIVDDSPEKLVIDNTDRAREQEYIDDNQTYYDIGYVSHVIVSEIK